MLSARYWKNRRVPWHALVFWVWLSGFVFSFTASDLFHAPQCPEQLALQWTVAPSHHGAVQTQLHLPASVDLDCTACAIQHITLGLGLVLVWIVLSLVIAIIRPQFDQLQTAFVVSAPIARGPPHPSR